MSVNIENIKRKLLIKYPMFGKVTAHLEFKQSEEIDVAATDGKTIIYNNKSIEKFTEAEQLFIFAHEVCHIAFDHIARSKGKSKTIWSIATDAVINALLKKDGLEFVKGGIDIPEAINHSAESMYKVLLDLYKVDEEKIKEAEKMCQNCCSHKMWEEGKEKDTRNKKQINEKSAFEQNKKEKECKLKEFSKELAKNASKTGTGINKNLPKVEETSRLLNWQALLKQATRRNEDWTRKNSRMRNNLLKHKLKEVQNTETEIVVDVSGSISENLLKNFLKECRNIITTSKVKIGFFNTEFQGFRNLNRIDDLNRLKVDIGGGTDFDVAVEAFSKSSANKIIFTDGYARMPEKLVNNLIWVVYGEGTIEPKCGQVIYIREQELEKLNQKPTQQER